MLNQPYIIYVEDDSFSRTVMEMILKKGLGHKNLVIYENSNYFIERLDSLPVEPEIIFLDIHMGPYDGFTLLKMIRENPKYCSVKVIALTASVMNEEVSMLQESGFDGGLAKPLDMELFPDLLERIRQGDEVWYTG